MGALRVGLLSRVMALVQNSIYHDATDFCGRGGRKMDELLLTWSKWIIEGRQGSNLAPTKWLICPFDGNLGRSSPTRIPDRSQQFSPFTNASTNTISAPDALMVLPTPPVLSPPTAGPAVSLRNYSDCRHFCRQLLLAIVGDCAAREEPGWTTKTSPSQCISQGREQSLRFCEDKHH